MTALRRPASHRRKDWNTADLAVLPEEFHYELINGGLVVPPGTSMHHLLCAEVAKIVRRQCPAGLTARFAINYDVGRGGLPYPDVVVVADEDAAPVGAPLDRVFLAIDVALPGWHFNELFVKTTKYATAGIPHQWIIEMRPEREVELTHYSLGTRRAYEEAGFSTKVFVTPRPFQIVLNLGVLADILCAGQADG
jgi:hypothetical protein